MKSPVANILLLRRDPAQLSPRELALLEGAFPERNLLLRRIDPVDYEEHWKLCKRFRADAVLLPGDKPIPSLAMEKGVPHLGVVADQLFRLGELVPRFTPYPEPSSAPGHGKLSKARKLP